MQFSQVINKFDWEGSKPLDLDASLVVRHSNVARTIEALQEWLKFFTVGVHEVLGDVVSVYRTSVEEYTVH